MLSAVSEGRSEDSAFLSQPMLGKASQVLLSLPVMLQLTGSQVQVQSFFPTVCGTPFGEIDVGLYHSRKSHMTDDFRAVIHFWKNKAACLQEIELGWYLWQQGKNERQETYSHF